MATEESTKSQTKAEKRISLYMERLKEINSTDISGISLDGVEELCKGFELEVNTLDSKKSSILSIETRSSLKHQYCMTIQRYRNTNKEVHPFNKLLTELTELKAPINKSQETSFKRKIFTARQELEKLKSNLIISSYHKQDLIIGLKTEIKRLCGEYINQILSQVPQEIRDSIKKEYITSLKQCRDIIKCYELISELTGVKAPINQSQETTFERKISTARQQLEELKSSYTIDSYHKRDLIQKYKTELKRLDEVIAYRILLQSQRRYIVQCYELIPELTKMKAPINKSQEPKFEREISTARQKLKELKSNGTIEVYIKQDLILKIETELKRLIEEFINQLQLPQEIRDSIKEEYITNVNQCRNIVEYYELIPDLTKLKVPINKSQETTFERQTSTARQELEELKSNETIGFYHKQDLIGKIETEFNRLDKEVTDQFLNVEVWDSIDLIEKTLAEPHLYSLPHLIMWRNTAQEKIQKIKNFPKPIPQEIIKEKIEKYESLIIQLRAEILKLRTYPIPEPWGSHCMRVELTYLMKGEFIFFVHPGIEEDMRPLKLSDREILPGGLTRQEYNSRMNGMKRESTITIEKLKAKNERSDIKVKQKWFKDSFAEIEKDVNFAFTELPLLYRDGRSLEYLVDKNQDDELLQEIYDTLLRRIRHFYNNRINIPSIAIDYYKEPMFVAPPKAERNIPIASGVDRGATDGLQLVTPASVVVYKNTVFVADKYGHSISYYRDRDLEAIGSYHHTTADTPVSITAIKDSLYACYSNELVQFSLSWGDKYVESIQFQTSIKIPQICCTTSLYNPFNFITRSSNCNEFFVGTLKPSLIILRTDYDGVKRRRILHFVGLDTPRMEQEYPLEPIRYHTDKKNRYPWLQDMKAREDSIFCLFTGSPSPLQEFSFKGELRRSVLTEDKIVGAYHFNLFWNPVTDEYRIYITDFWDSAIKVFNLEGQFIETFSEKGFYLGQIIQPTGIFVEESGFITVCDMKEDNCLQRL